MALSPWVPRTVCWGCRRRGRLCVCTSRGCAGDFRTLPAALLLSEVTEQRSLLELCFSTLPATLVIPSTAGAPGGWPWPAGSSSAAGVAAARGRDAHCGTRPRGPHRKGPQAGPRAASLHKAAPPEASLRGFRKSPPACVLTGSALWACLCPRLPVTSDQGPPYDLNST